MLQHSADISTSLAARWSWAIVGIIKLRSETLCAPALEFRRAYTGRTFSGRWNISQLRMAHVAFFVVRIVLQRYLHRVTAAFKSKLEGFVAHRSLSLVSARLIVLRAHSPVPVLLNPNYRVFG
jgi:hypothetical protein